MVNPIPVIRYGIKVCVLLCCTGLMATAHSEGVYLIGRQLLAACESEIADFVICVGYLEGVADTVNDVGVDVCKPDSVSVHDLIVVFKRYAIEHPAALDLSASGLAIVAFADVWPCD